MSAEPQFVDAHLLYFSPPKDGSKPYTHVNNDPVTGERRINWVPEEHIVQIENLRGKEDSVTLDTAGYHYGRSPSAHKAFTSDDDIKMDELDVRLVQGKAIMNWRAAIIEQIQHKHQMATWRRADADELAGAKKAERKFVETRGGWTCHKCPTPSSFGGFQWLFIARHLEKAHDIKEPSVENGDMSVALNSGDVYAAGIYKMTLPGYEMLHLSKKGSWSTQRAETYNHII